VTSSWQRTGTCPTRGCEAGVYTLRADGRVGYECFCAAMARMAEALEKRREEGRQLTLTGVTNGQG